VTVLVRCFQDDINNPPKLGSVLTIKHTGRFNSGKLKDPFFWRERLELEN